MPAPSSRLAIEVIVETQAPSNIGPTSDTNSTTTEAVNGGGPTVSITVTE